MARDFIFTSESVSEGHPDKMSDQVSDAILDAILAEDPHARVACETLFKTGMVIIAGEITTTAKPDLSLIHISEPTRPRLVSRMPSSA